MATTTPTWKVVLDESLHIAGLAAGAATLGYGVLKGNEMLALAGAGIIAPALAATKIGRALESKSGALSSDVKVAEKFLPLIPPQYQAVAKAALGDLEGALDAISEAQAQPANAVASAAAVGAEAGKDPGKAL